MKSSTRRVADRSPPCRRIAHSARRAYGFYIAHLAIYELGREGVYTYTSSADSMEEEKEYQEAEDFDAWKLDRGESEMTHQLEFAMK